MHPNNYFLCTKPYHAIGLLLFRVFIQPCFLSGLRSYVEHRCIALLYYIPLGNFNCVIMSGSSGAVNQLAEGL